VKTTKQLVDLTFLMSPSETWPRESIKPLSRTLLYSSTFFSGFGGSEEGLQ